MRAGLWGMLLAGVVGTVGVVAVVGCRPELEECVSDVASLEAASKDGMAVSLLKCSKDGAGGGGGTIDPTCVPSENKVSVDDACGVFVSTSLGDDTNDGTRAKPVKTLSRGLEKAKGLPVYACAELLEEELTGVVVAAGTRIFGGLDCDAAAPVPWAYTAAKKTEVTAPQDQVPMRLEKGSGTELTELHDVRVWAKAAKAPGGSSIAVIADEVTAVFVRSVVEAMDGAPGVDGVPYPDPAMAGTNGIVGVDACTQVQVFGGIGPSNGCSKGGNGGNGSTDQGGNGNSGTPAGNPNFGVGAEEDIACGDGKKGADGSAGTDSGNATALGKLDKVAGYVGAAGQDGTPGTPGQGGGGGGGTRSYANGGMINQCGGGVNGGASGGSGASGGCGGAGGHAGGSGGASIAVVSIKSVLTFDTSQVIAGNGAQPGNGEKGQSGGPGGPLGGPGGKASGTVKEGCKGGPGGSGGNGGKGGNGVGGHAIGIAYIEPSTTTEPIVFKGGKDVKVGTEGTGGVSADMQPFE